MTPEELKILHSLGASPQLLGALNKTTETLKPIDPLDLFVTCDPKMLSLKNKTRVLAKAQSSVLIVGETGTGKELIAKALHSTRQGPFVGFDCGTIHPELMESELFGTTKGAYTGCNSDRAGLIESAKEGTLFLDEITNMPMFLQCKLLRVLEAREVRRLGSTKFEPINCRIIAATNDTGVPNDKLRIDLYYRLKGSLLETSPLRFRREDIKLIVEFYDKQHKIDPQMVELWTNEQDLFPFMGNARELKNLVEETILLSELIDKAS